jgi:hypothetical protein
LLIGEITDDRKLVAAMESMASASVAEQPTAA